MTDGIIIAKPFSVVKQLLVEGDSTSTMTENDKKRCEHFVTFENTPCNLTKNDVKYRMGEDEGLFHHAFITVKTYFT